MLAVGASTGTVVATAGPAAALPYNCTFNEEFGKAGYLGAACYSGSGSFRVSILCGSSPTNPVIRKYGDWVGVNNVSFQKCDDGFAPYYISGTVKFA